MKEANRWLEKAEKDLLAAQINFQQGLEVSSFLSHQAAEKALKNSKKVVRWAKEELKR